MEGIDDFYVSHNFDDLFSLNLLSYELLIVCGWISSISSCFCDKIKQKEPTKALSVINSTKTDQQKLFL
jgi:hypothetical protein